MGKKYANIACSSIFYHPLIISLNYLLFAFFIHLYLSVLDIFTWSNIVLMNTFFSFLRMTFSVTSRKILINMQNKSKVTPAITYMYIWIFLKYAGRVRVIIYHIYLQNISLIQDALLNLAINITNRGFIQTHHLAPLISL